MYKILLADDEPNILDGLEYVINWDEHGIEIAGKAHNGAEALELLARQPVDMLLTDIRMPKMDGLELIQQIKKSGMDTRCIILSGYDDFEYIKQAVRLGIENYLLKPVNREELSATLLTTIEKIESDHYRNINESQSLSVFRENIMLRWLTGSISEGEFVEKAALAGIGTGCGAYTVAILRFPGARRMDGGRECDTLQARAKGICTGLAQGGKAIAVSDLEGGVILLFPGADPARGRPEICALLDQCMKEIAASLKVEVFVSIGGTVAGQRLVHESYESASELQGFSLILPANSIVDHDEVIRAVADRQNKFVIDFQSFDRMLQSRMEGECLRFLDDMLARLGSAKGVSPKFVQNVVSELLYHVHNIVRSAPGMAQQAGDFEVDFAEVYRIHRLDELAGWLKNAVVKAIGYMDMSEGRCSPHIKMLLAYIHDHYNKDLSIKQLSSQFNINTAYLGQLFKNETGEMFSNYINKIRIEKAKELLLTTNLKAADISEMVGYPNTNYFYRVFKKVTGVSPTEYR